MLKHAVNVVKFDDTRCALGEGPLWHPLRKAYFWFDVLGRKLFCKAGGQRQEWQFDDHVSAAGWVDVDRLIIASEHDLFIFDLNTGGRTPLVALEPDDATTRSNDGRADLQGGFWIGTMAFDARPGAGAIYRYYGGELRKLHADISIPNAICFAPDGGHAYFTDTPTQKVMRQAIDRETGWPVADAEVWLDLAPDNLFPDGAITDAAGNVWIAQWGAWRVACYSPEGQYLREIRVPVSQSSCPAFGGDALTEMLVTSARVDLSAEALKGEVDAGSTYLAQLDFAGRADGPVRLD